ncbi:DUF3422 domain-containing protein [Arsukibacterium sp.]|uniref:DUF3422 family protein n=1 Tax=Arsukibacterium sp. TaxID=1977258 RepID=UPI00299D8A8E|nr:DUF3422 domain-containing protein [Arsukibacterium sp.]MDX1676267.1 DUF3422 domain-containing protein [Arsukibacterium sp.]
MSKLTLRNHPLRDVLDKELRQRTFPALSAPCRLCHFTFTVASASRQLEFSLMQQQAELQGAHLTETDQDLNISLFAGTLRWERHGEFSSYTFILPGTAPALFDDPLSFLPSRDWFDELPGQLFRVVQLTVIADSALAEKGEISRYFNDETCISSMLANEKARIWTDFQKHAEGAGRLLLVDYGLTPARLGRLAQQLFDLGNYRKLALLGWPVARQALTKLNNLEQQLSGLTQQMELERNNDEPLLNQISQLAAQTEHLIAETSSRLSATAAYYQLTQDRLKALDETPISDLISLQDFTERRLTPAFRTSQSVQQRQTALSARLGRSTELLRTRINLKLEQQNQQLLVSMDKKARQQLKLQQVVESLSFVAISYYAAQLTEKALHAAALWLPQFNLSLWRSISLPAVLMTVALVLWFLSRQLKKDNSS